MQRIRPIVCLIALNALFSALPERGAGQQSRPPFPVPRTLSYDAARNGPLLTVIEPGIGSGDIRLYSETEKETAAALQDERGKRVAAGRLMVIAPKTMSVLDANPNSRLPYSTPGSDKALQALLSLFGEKEWNAACSPQGIGLDALNAQQRELFLRLLPEKMLVQSSRFVAGAEPGRPHLEDVGAPQQIDPLKVRLRLVRRLRFQFAPEGQEVCNVTGSVPLRPGTELLHLPWSEVSRDDRKQEGPEASIVAYGVTVEHPIPNHLKPGQLDFTSLPLRRTLPLNHDLKNVGDLVARIAKQTGMDLMADARLSRLPLFLRFTPGQEVRNGDALHALCWATCGTFRRVGDRTYLLTEDVKGIGARLAHLEEWAEQASRAETEETDRVHRTLLDHIPLAKIGFAPDDPNALPPDLMQQVDARYRRSYELLQRPAPFALSELPPAIQQIVQRAREETQRVTRMRLADRVLFDTDLETQFVLPNGKAVPSSIRKNNSFISIPFLIYQQISDRLPARPATRPSLPEPALQPRSVALKSRVLAAPMPPEAAALTSLLRLAKQKGFTEVWFRVRLDDPHAADRLKTAQIQGKRLGLAIGADVALLHGGGLPGPEEVNIQGEPGSAFVRRKLASVPAQSHRYDGYSEFAGWTCSDPAREIRLLLPLARVPGLSNLTIQATMPPGLNGTPFVGHAATDTGSLGYSLPDRLACLRALGFDPIDLPRYLPPALREVRFPFFTDNLASGSALASDPSPVTWERLRLFRLARKRQEMQQIYTALHRAAPALVLTLDQFSYSGAEFVQWNGVWNDPNVFQPGVSPGVTEAHPPDPSKQPLLRCSLPADHPEQPAAALARTAQKAQGKWPGIVLDLFESKPQETLRLLGTLPDLPTR